MRLHCLAIALDGEANSLKRRGNACHESHHRMHRGNSRSALAKHAQLITRHARLKNELRSFPSSLSPRATAHTSRSPHRERKTTRGRRGAQPSEKWRPRSHPARKTPSLSAGSLARSRETISLMEYPAARSESAKAAPSFPVPTTAIRGRRAPAFFIARSISGGRVNKMEGAVTRHPFPSSLIFVV